MNKKLNTLDKIYSLMDKRYKKGFFFIISLSIVSGFLSLVSVASVLPFLNVASNPSSIENNQFLGYLFSYMEFETSRDFLLFLGISLTIIIFIVNFLNTIFFWVKTKYLWFFYNFLSVSLLAHYMKKKYVDFSMRNSSDLQKNIHTESHEVMYTIISPIFELFFSAMSIFMIMTLLIYHNPTIAFTSLFIFATAYIFIYIFYKGSLTKIGTDSLDENKLKFKIASEALGSFKIASLMNIENYFVSRFSKASKNLSKNQIKRIVISSIPRYLLETIAFGLLIGISIFIIKVNDNFNDAIPLLGLYGFAAFRLLPQAQIFYSSYSMLSSGLPRLHNLSSELQDYDSNKKNNSEIDFSYFDDFKKIELKNITFSYPSSKKKTLNDITLNIDNNSLIGFFGETGSGKSTLIDMIIGLIQPDEGSIKIDGKNLNSNNIKSWKEKIGYVPQETYLIDGSVYENIALGINNIDRDKVKKVCEKARIAEFISKDLPNEYETIIGERGMRISGGQRQRLAIARALYRNPMILVFDEATSALDSETESLVMDSINSLSGEKTIIMIAHRISTLKMCNKLFEIKSGKVIRSGNYKEIFDSI